MVLPPSASAIPRSHERASRGEVLPDGRLACEACGFTARDAYPNLDGDLCEVHHRRPLSEAVAPVATSLADLAIMCPNCHRAIHRTDPLMSVEEFRTRFFADGIPRLRRTAAGRGAW